MLMFWAVALYFRILCSAMMTKNIINNYMYNCTYDFTEFTILFYGLYDSIFRSFDCVSHHQIALFCEAQFTIVSRRVAMLSYINSKTQA